MHKDLQGKYDELSNEANGLRKANADYEVEVKEQKDKISRLENDMKRLMNDTTSLGEKLRLSQNQYDKLNKQYEYVVANNSFTDCGKREREQSANGPTGSASK